MFAFVSRSVAALAAFALTAAPALAGPTLTGPMSSFDGLLGAPWTCTTNFPAMFDDPARTEQSMLAFDAVSADVLHSHGSTAGFASDSYFGYFAQGATYWVTRSDSRGVTTSMTSSDGRSYAGSMRVGPLDGTVSTVLDLSHAGVLAVHNTIAIGGRQFVIDQACRR